VYRFHARSANETSNDAGFTLIEVVVAIAMLGILSTAALGVYLSGVNSAATQQRRQVAIAIANSAMEKAIAWPAGTATIGRGANAVSARWTANDSIPGVRTTYKSFDASAPTNAVGALPVTNASGNSVNGTNYTVDILVGTCFQIKPTVGLQPGGPCTVTTGWPNQPAVPSNKTKLTRVIVVVRWTAGAGCATGNCNYHASTLIDSNLELDWNTP